MTDEDQQNQRLARAWLGGFLVIGADHLRHLEYLIVRSPEEKRARVMVADALRENTLGRDLRLLLADLIDPDPDSGLVEREIAFRFRRRGGRTEVYANSQIASFIWESIQAGETVDAAVVKATVKFKKERSRVYEIWSTYKPLFEAIARPEK